MSDVPSASSLRVVDWGRRGYADALAAQRRLQAQVLADEAPDTLVLVEHDPVITLTPRAAKAGRILADPDRLGRLGIEVHETDRGGDATYHGPGQLVVYPVVRLDRHGLNLSTYMRLLERVVIDTVAAFGVEAFRETGYTGVWVREPRQPAPAKICAMGVRIRKHVSMHGLALNVDTDLSHFRTIVPCGLEDRAVTSLRQRLGDRCPSFERVKDELTRRFADALAEADAAAPLRNPAPADRGGERS